MFHNASFDIAHLRRWAGWFTLKPEKFWDTLIMERILWNGYYDDFGLADLSRRYLDIELEKDVRSEFYTEREITDEMVMYAALDALVTWKVQQEQEVYVRQDPATLKVWEEIDAPALFAILDFKGITLDVKEWKRLAIDARQRAGAIQELLGFNPGSPKQTKTALRKIGLETGNAGLALIPSTAEKVILPYKHVPTVQLVLDYREAAKQAGTYGEEFINYVEADGRIYSHYDVTGAVTGRMASRDPNGQNLPHLKSYRSCFIAPRGRRLIVADVSAQEPRFTAELSRDPVLLRAFEQGEDVHWSNTRVMYDLPDDAPVDKERRRIGKATLLAMIYGQKAYGMAEKTGLSVEEAERVFKTFFNKLRGVATWILRQHAEADRTGIVRTPSGRRMFLNPYSWQAHNHATNMPHQGGSADQIKIALGYLHREYGRDLPIAMVVHDEFVAECATKDVKKLVKMIVEALEYASKVLTPHVSLRNLVEVHVGTNWGVKYGEM